MTSPRFKTLASFVTVVLAPLLVELLGELFAQANEWARFCLEHSTACSSITPTHFLLEHHTALVPLLTLSTLLG